jgi:septal ring factor EnvC (AmiA/AmiB activator)
MLVGAMMQNIKLIALIAIVAAALIYRAVLVHQRDSARAQVTALSDAAAGLRAENASMAAAVARQNAAVNAVQDKMKAVERDAAQREANSATNAARTMNAEIAHANAERNAAVPAGCQGAIDWGNAQGPELGRW